MTAVHDACRMPRLRKGMFVRFPPDKPRQSQPIQAEHILAIAHRLDMSRARDFQFWTQLLVSYKLLLRAQELCSLTVDDVRFEHDMVEVTVRDSKTNRGKPPFSVWLVASPKGAHGPRRNTIQAVPTLVRYFQKMQWDRHGPEDPKSTKAQAIPLFLKLEDRKHFVPLKGRKALSVAAWRKQLQYWITQAGLDAKQFGTHKIRAGGNTDMLAFGLRPSFVAAAGRWSSGDRRKYNRPDAQLIAKQARLALDQAHTAATR